MSSFTPTSFGTMSAIKTKICMGWKSSGPGSRKARQAFPDLRLTIEQIFGEADRVMAYVRGRATHNGEFIGIPATGSAIEWTATALIRVADSKIAECWVIADTLGILQQLGVIQRTQ